MKKTTLLGRTRECARLDACMQEEQAQLIIIYGRRRVGKTFLINEYFDRRFDFKLTGAHLQPLEMQLRNFTDELNRQTRTKHETPKDWLEAFSLLRDYLSARNEDEKTVVFIDEMPWLDTPRSNFLPAFEWFWNDFGSAERNLIFVVCGSATSWMTEHIAKNKGGLFNRQTCRLYLQPFTLHEVEEYLQRKRINWSRYDIAVCYMILGGIPYYLSLLDESRTFADNIDNLFFRKRAELWDEFDHLYQTLFTNSEQYIKIVEALSQKRRGLTRTEIAEKTGISKNGTLSKMLNDLSESDFVRAYSFFNHKKKETVYQLADYYTLFYFRFIKENYGHDEHFWANALDNPSRRAWAGLTFEQLCKDHIGQVKKTLGISAVLSEESTWSVRANEDGESGAEIDILIDRRDRVINVCEVKFSVGEFVIDKDYDRVLRNKIDAFQRETNTKKSLQLTLITTFGVKQNTYSSLVGSEVVLDDLFAE